MLGTNDLTERFSVSASDIAQSAAGLANISQRSECGPDGGAPEVLLISPRPVGKLADYAEMFEGSSHREAEILPETGETDDNSSRRRGL
jgi:hypothetical protein